MPYTGVPDVNEAPGAGAAPAIADRGAAARADSARASAELAGRAASAHDPLSRWVFEYLAAHPRAALEEVVAASLDRRFSASPHETFFTGGGVHTFVNFNPDDNGRIMTVREGIRNSVNLVFIRLMREIVQYHKAALGYDERAIFTDTHHPVRRELLDEFVAGEGRKLLWRYYHRYRDKSEAEATALLFGRRLTPRTVAIAHYYLHGPDSPPAALAAALAAAFGPGAPDSLDTARLTKAYARTRLSRQDAAYLGRLHPLELWTVEHLLAHPDAEWSSFTEASSPALVESYDWLYRPRAKRAQDARIRILLETKAFAEIHTVWQRLGYPFGSLVPSLATSIGSSADRPAALAELVGIILRDGVRAPMQRVQNLDFAAGTPYEIRLEPDQKIGREVMPREVAGALRGCLVDVVENGTARRAHGAVHDTAGALIPIGGKTGSGDNRIKSFARGGRLIGSQVVSRTASFAFFIGDRFFGVITAYVAGEEAAAYSFTSSLPTQILKILGPSLEPLAAPIAALPAAAATPAARTAPAASADSTAPDQIAGRM